MLLKNSGSMMPGDNAGLAINLASARQYCELRFWYMKDSTNFADLNINRRDQIGQPFTLIKNINYLSNKGWVREKVTIAASLSPIQVWIH